MDCDSCYSPEQVIHSALPVLNLATLKFLILSKISVKERECYLWRQFVLCWSTQWALWLLHLPAPRSCQLPALPLHSTSPVQRETPKFCVCIAFGTGHFILSFFLVMWINCNNQSGGSLHWVRTNQLHEQPARMRRVSSFWGDMDVVMGLFSASFVPWFNSCMITVSEGLLRLPCLKLLAVRR